MGFLSSQKGRGAMTGFDADYLMAKKRVDEYALNRRVWDRFVQECSGPAAPTTVLDLGAGSGSFFDRLLEGTELGGFRYIALDADQRLLDELTKKLDNNRLKTRNIRVEPVAERVEEFLDQDDSEWELIVSNAFLDLVDLKTWGRAILDLLAPKGLFYCTMLFDGVTTLLPKVDAALDAEIEALYHDSMSKDGRSGPRAGREVLDLLLGPGFELLEAGPSDWTVLPRAGTYREGEAELLRVILEFHEAVLLHQTPPSRRPPRVAEWLALRREQLSQGKLALFTHQWDILGRRL